MSGDKQEDSADLCVNRGGSGGEMMPLEEPGDVVGKDWQEVEKRKPGMGVAVYHCFQGASLQHE